ncbi:MAG TPA: nicotinate phosphoribosyltransferase, partial [Vicinamibacteria bacterium]|nr:nicotinate phosphoribosyltransferase [Vicinamibacteria bacterium]
DSELEAFRSFAALYPETILLVDTYDSAEGVRNVVRLSRELGEAFHVSGVRLDSGDLAAQAKSARAILDAASLAHVSLFASGGLDEYEIERLVQKSPEIGGFGVGTRMGVSADAPALDMAYKLTSYAARGRLKLSQGKRILPGRKQVFRVEEDGVAVFDILAREGEDQPGRPLLRPVMSEGERLDDHVTDLELIRENTRRECSRLEPRFRSLEPAEPRYRVEVSEALRRHQEQVVFEVQKSSRQGSGEEKV